MLTPVRHLYQYLEQKRGNYIVAPKGRQLVLVNVTGSPTLLGGTSTWCEIDTGSVTVTKNTLIATPIDGENHTHDEHRELLLGSTTGQSPRSSNSTGYIGRSSETVGEESELRKRQGTQETTGIPVVTYLPEREQVRQFLQKRDPSPYPYKRHHHEGPLG